MSHTLYYNLECIHFYHSYSSSPVYIYVLFLCLIPFVGEKAKSSALQSELDKTGTELLNAQNFVEERDNSIVGLYEEIEMLRKPNAKEEKLKKEVEELNSQLNGCHVKIDKLRARLVETDAEKLHWQREYDITSLYHEDWLAVQRRENSLLADQTNAQVTSLRNTIEMHSDEISALSLRSQISENELSKQEDALTRKHIAMVGLIEERVGLMKEVAESENAQVIIITYGW